MRRRPVPPSRTAVTYRRAVLVAFAAFAVLLGVPGSLPALLDVPVAPTAGDSWADEPSAASLAALADDRAGRTGGAGRAEQFYFLLPDRFANGDTGNDTGGIAGGRLDSGFDPTDKGFYHGGDLKGLLDRIDYIQGMGTTAIWMAPVFKNKPVQGSGNDVSAGYHGYWITDFTALDPHFGTEADLKRLVREAHRRGIKVYLDIITNHTADVIRYAENQYSYRSKADYPYRDAAGRPFDDRTYAAGDKGFPPVNTRSFPYTPVFATPADAHAKKPEWLNDPTMYHNRGDSTFSGENSEYGDFFGLDDLWTERPEVVRGMTKIYSDWATGAGVDGFRIDTVKHVNLQFWPQFSRGVTAAAGRDFFMFGEVFSADPELTSTYVRRGGLPATLDFPFQAAAANYTARGASARELAGVFAADDLYTTGGTDARRLPTFLGNHDMGRIGMMVVGGGSDPATHLRRAQLAHELMFFSRGQPVVYSGDEQGFTGPGGDKDARQDMYASRTPDYLDDDLLGTDRTHAVDNYQTDHPLYRTIAALGALRKAHKALRDGVQVTRYAADGPGVFAFSRIDPGQQVEYVVAVNNADTPQTVAVPTYSAGMTFEPVYPATDPLRQSGADRAVSVTVPPLSTVVMKARSRLARPSTAPAVRVSTPAEGATVHTRAEVVADVPGAGLDSVSFAVQVGDGPWKLLGTANRPPYRVFHDLDGLAAGTRLTYKAVVRDSAGRTASALSHAVVGTPPVAGESEYLVAHYQRPAGDYGPWGLYTWGDIDPAWQTQWPAGQPFAGEDSYGRFAWVKLKPGARQVGFIVVDSNGVKDVTVDRFADPSRTPEIWLKQGDPAVAGSRAAATGVVSVHYGRPDGAYDGWGLHLWGDGVAASARTEWAAPRPPDGRDSYGPFWNVPVGDATKPFNFIVHRGDEKDPGPDQSLVPSTQGEAFVRSGEAAVHRTRAAAEHTAVLHYRRPDNNYTGWGVHVWTGAASPTDWGNPILPSKVDAYGAEFRVPLADNATELAYIIHRGDDKDLPADQLLKLVDVGHEVWILSGQPRYVLPIPVAGAPDTDIAKARAVWLDRDTIAWRTGATDGRAYSLRYDPAGGLSIVDGGLVGGPAGAEIRLHAAGGLSEAQRQKYPHLWQYQTFTVDPADRSRVPEALRSQEVVVSRDAAGGLLGATSVQVAGALDDLYGAAAHARLGPTFHSGRPSLAVWAPTARTVALELYDSPGATPSVLPMRRDDRTGVWQADGDRSWNGRFYKYRVTAWQPATRAVVTASVTDPYSVALAPDSTHSQLVDLADPALAPAGWARLRKPAANGKPQIQELSVRDFSIVDGTVPAEHRGTYLAFTDSGSAGMKHLGALAKAGTTHVHLLPVFDIASIPEKRADQAQPPCDLAAMAPDSSQQQECIGLIADRDGYNWGYDPWHYNVPEGSYATDPAGAVRTKQLRQAVAGLNGAGLRVVVDVVYNHTPAAGTAKTSVLDQIVPGYYQRLLEDGSLATSTCCANTATENLMMGKLVVDSVVLWARQYKVDGFRFDLMGHHPKANLLAVRAALDSLTLDRDGVDGKKIIMYGEGWDFGEVAGGARFEQATQRNMAGTGIGTFSDRLRDAVRGGGPFDGNPRVQGFASGLYTDPNGDPVNGTPDQQRARLLHAHDLIQLGLAGNLSSYAFVSSSSGARVTGAQVDYNGSPAGYTAAPGEAVTYVDAHDNEILYDTLAFKLPASTPAADRGRMQTLGLATTVLGQGTGFVTAGSDRLRSKSLDRNSFNSGDWFNAIQWDCAAGNGFGRGLPPSRDNGDKWPFARPLLAARALVPDCSVVSLAEARYAELLAVRGSSPVFGLTTAAEVQRRVAFPLSGTAATPGVITMTLDAGGLDRRWKSLVVVFNATPGAVVQRVPALVGKRVALHPVLAGSADPVVRQASFDAATGGLSVPARTVAVFVQT
jgi:pullulanase-type alpha-1,6-glucosidase